MTDQITNAKASWMFMDGHQAPNLSDAIQRDHWGGEGGGEYPITQAFPSRDAMIATLGVNPDPSLIGNYYVYNNNDQPQTWTLVRVG